MDFKEFGNTGLKVSAMGLGLAALGRPGYINLNHSQDLNYNYDLESMRCHAFGVMDQAYDLGIRYFDVARSYGKGEHFLADWIQKNPDKKITVASKWGYTYTGNWQVKADQHEIKNHSIEVLNRQWLESFDLLQEKIDIYHIHSATLESGVLQNEEVLDRLWNLKAAGVVVGLSLSGVRQAETLVKALEIVRDDDMLFKSVQVTWNILEKSATEILKEASAKGCGIIIKEALANGRLTHRNIDAAFKEKKLQLELIAAKYNVGIDSVSIAFVLRQPWVSSVLSGASSMDQVISNVKAFNFNLDDKDISILSEMEEKPADYWTARANLEWN